MSAKSVTPNANVKTPKGKQKRFLDNKDALSLATSIAEEQETKASMKSERHHKSGDVNDSQQRADGKRTSGSREKLKATKAALKASQLDAKRDRAKSRKQRLKGESSHEGKQPTPPKSSKARKSVSFA